MQGFLLVDKPGGPTSHDIVDRVRRATGVRKVGHAGTLDPMATGLLVVAVGPVTRLISHIQGGEKEYIAEARFGIATDSLDADGTEVSRARMPVTADEVGAVLDRFVGVIDQVPPMVSALKRDGVRLHELARRGEEVDRPARPVTIHALRLEDFAPGDHPTATLRVVCGPGTYIRVLADDIAGALGGRAHLVGLRRTRIGALSVDHAIDGDALGADTAPEAVAARLLDPVDALTSYPLVRVDADTERKVGDGRALGETDHPDGVRVRVVGTEGRLLAVYRAEAGGLVPDTVLPRPGTS